MRRRELIIGGMFAASAAAGIALIPRRRMSLKPEGKIADLIPLTFDGWSSEDADGLVQPDEGTLAASLYSEIVGRIYSNRETGDAVMMLAAYGDTQSDMLQLHRPEACYPAVGFKLVSTEPMQLPLSGGGVAIPARAVVAAAPDREEAIVYWARIGESLPNSAGAQREARLAASFKGIVPDGILVRFSTIHRQGFDSFAMLDRFIPQMIGAMKPADRPVLVGTKIARELNRA